MNAQDMNMNTNHYLPNYNQPMAIYPHQQFQTPNNFNVNNPPAYYPPQMINPTNRAVPIESNNNNTPTRNQQTSVNSINTNEFVAPVLSQSAMTSLDTNKNRVN